MLAARVSGDELSGDVTLVHADGKALKLPFTAKLGDTWRFYPEALTNNADFAGRWDVTFTDDADRRTPGVATFDQSFEHVTGTVQMPTGDQRYLAGEARDEELRLSRFDGGAVVLYEAKLDAREARRRSLVRPRRVAALRRDPQSRRLDRRRGTGHATTQSRRAVHVRVQGPRRQDRLVQRSAVQGQGAAGHARGQLVPQQPRRGTAARAARPQVPIARTGDRQPDVRAARGVRASRCRRATLSAGAWHRVPDADRG